MANRYNTVVDKLLAKSEEAKKCNFYRDMIESALSYSYEILPPAFQKAGGAEIAREVPTGAASHQSVPAPPSQKSLPWHEVTPPSDAGDLLGSQYPGNQPEGNKTSNDHASGGSGNRCMPGESANKSPCPKLTPEAARKAYDGLQESIEKIEKHTFYQSIVDCANDLPKLADYVSTYINTIPTQVDPPMDSVLHSLQFVIANGASVTPSWTLLQWRGPGQSGTFAGVNSVRTHNLQLALGPRTGQAPISQDATRLIQNQTVKSLANSGGGG